MKLVESEFKDYKLAKKSRKLLLACSELAITGILVFIIYLILITIGINSIPIIKSNYNNLKSYSLKLSSVVNETGLRSVDEKTGLSIDNNIIVDNYIINQIKTSYYLSGDLTLNGNKLEEEDLLISEANKNNFIYDNLAKYFIKYRSENETIYLNNSNNINYDINYFYNEILEFSHKNFQIADLFEINNPNNITNNDYPLIIKKNIALEINDYLLLKNNNNTRGETYYNLIRNSYINGFNKGIKDVESNNILYIQNEKEFEKYAHNLDINLIVIIFISFFVAFFLNYVFVPLILKNHQTISSKILGLVYVRCDNNKPTIFNRIIYLIFDFFTNLFLLATPSFFLLQVNLLTTKFLWNINLLYIIIFSFVLGLISIIFMLFNNKNMYFGEFISKIETRNLKELEIHGRSN